MPNQTKKQPRVRALSIPGKNAKKQVKNADFAVNDQTAIATTNQGTEGQTVALQVDAGKEKGADMVQPSEELKESICKALATDKTQVCSFNVLQPDFAAMPKTLKEIAAWVLWSGMEKVNEKTGEVSGLNKIPINASRYPKNAKTSDPETWTGFDVACATYKQNHGKPDKRPKDGILSGVGFVLAEGQGIVGIDIDHCVKADGSLENFAIPLVEKLQDTYCEVSPSGTGIRAFVLGVKKQGGNRSRNVEIYNQGRFLTVTGRTIGKSDIAADQSIIDFFQAYIDQPKMTKDNPKSNNNSSKDLALPDDRAIIDKIRKNIKTGKIFSDLFDKGDISAYSSNSEADMALAGIIAHWFGPDTIDIDRIMRQSAILLQIEGRLQKWDTVHCQGRTYGIATIETAVSNHKGQFYKEWLHEYRQNKKKKKENKAKQAEILPDDTLPIIQYNKGELIRCFNELQDALFPVVYQRDGKLVQIIRISKHKKKGAMVRQAGSTIIDLLTLPTCKFLADKLVNWEVWDSNANDYKLSNAPKIVIETLLAGMTDWRFRVLTGMVNCPVMRPDGSILEKPGYDDDTGLFADFDKGQFPKIELDTSKIEGLGETDKNNKLLVIAQDAWAIIKDALSEFPFKDGDEDGNGPNKSVAIAAILTAVMRQCVPFAPLFAFSAPTPGTGKSALADLVAIIATGLAAAAVNFSPDKVEMDKALFSILLEGAPVVLVDNIVGEINSPTWNIILSQGELQGRILGVSKMAKVSTNALWLATGNNMQLVGDMTRRSLFCELDSGMERPAERKFNRNIYEWAKANRGELVKGALTILQAYQIAGRPCQDQLKPMNGYDEWSAIVRGPIVWLGFADPIETQKMIEAYDPQKAAVASVFSALWERFGKKPFEVREIVNPSMQVLDDEKAKIDRLKEALDDAIGNPRGFTSRAVGKWFAKNKNTIVNGFQLFSRGKIAKIETWQIRQIE